MELWEKEISMKTRENLKNWLTAGAVLLFCLCAAGVLTGCNEDDDPAPAPTNADWEFTLTNGENGSDRVFTLSLPWQSTDDIASGTLNISGYIVLVNRTGPSSVEFDITAPDGSNFVTAGVGINGPPTNSAVGTYSGTDNSTSPPTTITSQLFGVVKV